MELTPLRKKIDQLDTKILELLVERLAVSKEIGEYKKRNNISIQNKEREKQVITERIQKFKELGFNEEKDAKFVAKLFKLIMKKSREVQDE